MSVGDAIRKRLGEMSAEMQKISDQLFPSRDSDTALDDYASKNVVSDSRLVLVEGHPDARWDPYAHRGRGAWMESDAAYRRRLLEKYEPLTVASIAELPVLECLTMYPTPRNGWASAHSVIRFAGGIEGTYKHTPRITHELGPFHVVTADRLPVTVTVSGAGYLSPDRVRARMESLTMKQLRDMPRDESAPFFIVAMTWERRQ